MYKYCKTCNKWIGELSKFTKKPYCSQKCEKLDKENDLPEFFNTLFNNK